MKNIFFVSLLMMTSLSVTTRANENDDDFTFLAPVFNGTGCPRGTGSVSMSPEQESISIIYDQFQVEVPQFDGDNDNDRLDNFLGNILHPLQKNKLDQNLNAKNCNILLNAHIPKGRKVIGVEISFDFRGYISLQKGIQAFYRSQLVSRQGLNIQDIPQKELLMQKIWRGKDYGDEGLDEEFSLNESKFLAFESHCADIGNRQNRLVRLNLNTVIAASIGPLGIANGATGLLNIDSTDITSALKVKFHTLPCQIAKRPLPVPPRRPIVVPVRPTPVPFQNHLVSCVRVGSETRCVPR